MSEGLNIILIGPHGVGKTKIVREEAQRQGTKCRPSHVPHNYPILLTSVSKYPTRQRLVWRWTASVCGTQVHTKPLFLDRVAFVTHRGYPAGNRSDNTPEC